MARHRCCLPLIAASLTLASANGHADIYATATIVTKDGETVSSDRMRMDEGDPEGKAAWKVELKQTDSWVEIEYNRLRKITISTIEDCEIEKGVVTLDSGESFELIDSAGVTKSLFQAGDHSLEVPVVDPVNGGQTMRDIHCYHVREITFPDNAAGSFRRSADGRYYPPDYVFDPVTGEKMPLVEGTGRTSKAD